MKNATFANKTKARIAALPDTAVVAREQVNIDFAKTALKADIAPGTLARVMQVTRASIHSWLIGKRINRSHALRLLELVKVLQEDVAKGDLPKVSKHARQQYEEALFATMANKAPASNDERVGALNLKKPELERWLLGK
jgi:DNA-binding transcriptional regulator YiaG